MSKLEKTIYELNQLEQVSSRNSLLRTIDPRAKLLITLFYITVVLSLPLYDLTGLILFGIYPIVSSALAGMGYGRIFFRSLYVLPFIVFIGIFNPLIDRDVVFYVGDIGITTGWISFTSILLRGLLSVQAVLILVYSSGFYNLCRGMQKLGLPSLFTTQLLFVYRYISVLLEEALSMQRARDARGFGRKSYPLKMWGTLIGQLLIRTVNRSERIHRAMLSRGFTGKIEGSFQSAWSTGDTLYLIIWGTLMILLRLFQPAGLFELLMS